MSGAIAAAIAAAFTIAAGGGSLGYTLGANTFKNGSSVTTLTTDAVATASSGSHFFIAVVYGSGSGVTSVADNKGNSANYVEIGTEQSAGSSLAKIRWWYCPNGAGGSGHTATVNFGSAEDPTVFFWEWGGLLASGSLDQAAQATDSSTPFSVTSGTTTQANEVVFALLGSSSGDNPATKADTSGGTIIRQSTNGTLYWTGAVSYRTVTATGAQTATFTDGGTAGNSLKIATFKRAP